MSIHVCLNDLELDMEPEPHRVLGVLMSDLKCEASKDTLRKPEFR